MLTGCRIETGRLDARGASARPSLAVQFGLAGAWLGLLAGIYEAAFIYSRPRIPVLIKPDVGYAIWIFAPLIDELLFGLAGLALGAAASLQPSPRRVALMASIGWGAVAGFLVDETFWVHLRMAGHHAKTWRIVSGTAVVLLITRLAQLACMRRRKGPASLSESPRRWSFDLLAKGAGIATALLVAALVLYLIRPTGLLPSVRPTAAKEGRGPNIVLISLDTVRADHLHSYGYPRATTPNLDLAGQRGVLFEYAVAPSSWTLASHSSMLTGLLPHQHGADFDVPMPGGVLTLAQALKDRGYQTAGFTSNYDYGYIGWGIAQGFETYDDDSSSPLHNLLSVPTARRFRQLFFPPVVSYDLFGRRDAAELNRDIIRWVRGLSGRPFFIFLNYFDAHDPYLAPAPYDKYFGSVSHTLVRRMSPIMNWRPPAQPLSPEDQQMLVAGYDNCLTYLDFQVGKLLHSLIESPDWPNTIVFITADHGEAFAEHGGYYGHGWGLNWELLHVPLIVMGRGVPAGLRISTIVGTTDLFSTVLTEAAGRASPSSGRSLDRFWASGAQGQDPGEPIVSELSRLPDPANADNASASVVTAEWHYIQDTDGGCQLYRWSVDPTEEHDLSQSPQYRGVRRDLRQQLQKAVDRSARPWRGINYLSALAQQPPRSENCVVRTNRAPDKQEEDLLKSLPYH